MKPRSTALLIFVAAFLVTACNDYSTPKGVAAAAYKAVRRQDLRKLRKALSEEALATYGSRPAMKELSEKLARYKTVRSRNLKLIEFQRVSDTQVRRYYSLDFEGDRSKIFAATIACHESVSRRNAEESSQCWIIALK